LLVALMPIRYFRLRGADAALSTQLGKMQDFKASASQARLKLHDCEGSLQDEIERRKQVRFIRTSPVPWLGRLLRKP
jgi:hypothetical protein